MINRKFNRMFGTISEEFCYFDFSDSEISGFELVDLHSMVPVIPRNQHISSPKKSMIFGAQKESEITFLRESEKQSISQLWMRWEIDEHHDTIQNRGT